MGMNVNFDINKGLENPETKLMTRKFVWIGISVLIIMMSAIAFWIYEGKNIKFGQMEVNTKIDTTAKSTINYNNSAVQNGDNNHQENNFK